MKRDGEFLEGPPWDSSTCREREPLASWILVDWMTEKRFQWAGPTGTTSRQDRCGLAPMVGRVCVHCAQGACMGSGVD